MEVKSNKDCLNIVHDVIFENIGKHIGISNLENFHEYLLEKGQGDLIEDRIPLSNVLSRINCIIENQYQFGEGDIKSDYKQLRKLILV